MIVVYFVDRNRELVEKGAKAEHRSLSNFLITEGLRRAHEVGMGRPRLVRNASSHDSSNGRELPPQTEEEPEEELSVIQSRPGRKGVLSVVQAYCHDEDREIIEAAAKAENRSLSAFLQVAAIDRAMELGFTY